MSDKVEEKMHKIKKKDRSYMKPSEWSSLQYANSNWCQVLLNNCPSNELAAVDYEKCSDSEFQAKYA